MLLCVSGDPVGWLIQSEHLRDEAYVEWLADDGVDALDGLRHVEPASQDDALDLRVAPAPKPYPVRARLVAEKRLADQYVCHT